MLQSLPAQTKSIIQKFGSMYNISRKSLPLYANTLSAFLPEHLANPWRTALNVNTPTCPTATLLLLRHARVIESSHLNFASALVQMFIQLFRVRVLLVDRLFSWKPIVIPHIIPYPTFAFGLMRAPKWLANDFQSRRCVRTFVCWPFAST